MKNTFVVISSAGSNRDVSKGTREQPFWDGRHAEGSAPRERERGPALECILAYDGPGRRPIEMSALDGQANT